MMLSSSGTHSMGSWGCGPWLLLLVTPALLAVPVLLLLPGWAEVGAEPHSLITPAPPHSSSSSSSASLVLLLLPLASGCLAPWLLALLLVPLGTWGPTGQGGATKEGGGAGEGGMIRGVSPLGPTGTSRSR